MNPHRTFVLTVDRKIRCFDETAKYLDEIGFTWERFNGFDNRICQLSPVQTFDFDRVGERITGKHVAATLSHILLWKVMSYSPEDRWWSFEYDVRMAPNWQQEYERAMSVMPDDVDIIFLGSCCCRGRPTTHIGENVYEVKYPLCGHAQEIRRSALPVLLQEQQKICMPLDIALYHQAFPKLKVMTILPPIVVQHGTPLPP